MHLKERPIGQKMCPEFVPRRQQGVDTSSVIDQTCVIGPNIEVIAHVENPFICLILIQRENKLVHNFWFFAFCTRGVVKK